MGYLNIFLVLMLAQYGFSDPILKKNCEVVDSECGKEILQTFYKDYYGGTEDRKMIPLDPAIIPSLEYVNEEVGYTSKYTNLTITGFKDVVVSDFKIDSEKESTEFTLKFNFVAEGDVDIILKSGKTFSGTSKHEGGLAGAVKYSFVSHVENKIEQAIIGAETVKCTVDNLQQSISPDLEKALNADPEAQALKPKYDEKLKEYNDKEVCAFGDAIFEAAIENLRYAALLGFK